MNLSKSFKHYESQSPDLTTDLHMHLCTRHIIALVNNPKLLSSFYNKGTAYGDNWSKGSNKTIKVKRILYTVNY